MLSIMGKVVLILSIVLWATSASAAIYKWTDEQGNVHYSDEPHEGAAPMDLPPVPVFESPDIQVDLTPPPQPDEAGTYQAFAIADPEREATVRNDDGVLDVHLRVEPELKPGHRVQLYLDGQPVGPPKPSPDLRLSGIYRGAHTVSAAIVNGTGQTLAEAGPVTFYMHRPSVNLPANPNNPKP